MKFWPTRTVCVLCILGVLTGSGALRSVSREGSEDKMGALPNLEANAESMGLSFLH